MKIFCLITSSLLILSAKLAAIEQSIILQEGWNAVWLEVAPKLENGLAASPEVAFQTESNVELSLIASPKPLAGLAEVFGNEPGDIDGTFNQESWETWLRDDAANVNNLVTITGNRAYLIHAAQSTTLTVEGEVRFHRHQWVPDRYNLQGFGVSDVISFDDFFDHSDGRHPVGKIYALNSEGQWNLVTGSSPVGDGVAYWIFCNGTSDYMGPVAVDLPGFVKRKLQFGSPSDAVPVGSRTLDLEEIVFTNLGSAVAVPELVLEQEEEGLALFAVEPVPDTLEYSIAGGISALGESIDPDTNAVVTLGAERNWNDGAVERTNVYRLSTGGGNEVWLPISATHSDLQDPRDLVSPTLSGLWVGEVIIDHATSIVEDGSPLRPTSGAIPLRLILHADESGAVKLLSQVTLMQTKTAAPEIEPVPVLVVDPARIPFFEGIRERSGKWVGLRIESVAFDMPRKLDAASQAALLEDPAYPDLSEEGISDFLVARSLRPPSLAEDYHLTWDLTGEIGLGKELSTDQPLTLDPFHRSNPFRHAFHQRHARGAQISRSLKILFESDDSFPDLLHATYREILDGLTGESLTLTGKLTLRRVSSVTSLQGN